MADVLFEAQQRVFEDAGSRMARLIGQDPSRRLSALEELIVSALILQVTGLDNNEDSAEDAAQQWAESELPSFVDYLRDTLSTQIAIDSTYPHYVTASKTPSHKVVSTKRVQEVREFEAFIQGLDISHLDPLDAIALRVTPVSRRPDLVEQIRGRESLKREGKLGAEVARLSELSKTLRSHLRRNSFLNTIAMLLFFFAKGSWKADGGWSQSLNFWVLLGLGLLALFWSSVSGFLESRQREVAEAAA